MENWKDIGEEKYWACKVGLVILFLMVLNIDARCNVGVFEHICDQGRIYLIWA
jgi:hypothetical protein